MIRKPLFPQNSLELYRHSIFKKDVYFIGQSETKSHRSTLMHHETWLDYERGILRRLPTPHGEKSSKLKCIGCRGLVNPTNAMLIIYLLVLTDESTQCFNGNEVRVYYVLSYYRVRAPDQYILIYKVYEHHSIKTTHDCVVIAYR